MTVSKNRKEQAALAGQDAKVFGRMEDELRDFNWTVEACGADGQMEIDKAKETAKSAIKILVNYL